ncbi:MAG: hypothetical protein HYW45_04015 [Candidatus Daviesbacteria bacterium]|nr:MAG: hypothetical protein HYW45_04015 [Candidatus Daviesbacteria bacterium]
MKKLTTKKVLLILTLAIFAFIGWFARAIFTDEPPHFFPLNNSKGEYRITKNCPNGQGWQEQFQGQGNAYCVEYKGPDVFINNENGNTNFFRITVGKSDIDLEQFNGKRVKYIEGKYTSSSKQCIQNKCIEIYGPLAVLNIEKLEIAE